MKNNQMELIKRKNNGYKTLIIWEHELKNLDKLINGLDKFIRR